MEIEAVPGEGGNLVVQDDELVDVLGPKQAAAARARGAALYRNHRWTCPANTEPLALAGRW